MSLCLFNIIIIFKASTQKERNVTAKHFTDRQRASAGSGAKCCCQPVSPSKARPVTGETATGMEDRYFISKRFVL